MEIKGNEALTPNKKQYLVDQIKTELQDAEQDMQQSDFGVLTISVVNKAKNELQNVLNKFLEKKGVITPSETADAMDKINALKRARLEEDYVLGIKKGTWFMIGFIAVGLGVYFYYKKQAK